VPRLLALFAALAGAVAVPARAPARVVAVFAQAAGARTQSLARAVVVALARAVVALARAPARDVACAVVRALVALASTVAYIAPIVADFARSVAAFPGTSAAVATVPTATVFAAATPAVPVLAAAVVSLVIGTACVVGEAIALVLAASLATFSTLAARAAPDAVDQPLVDLDPFDMQSVGLQFALKALAWLLAVAPIDARSCPYQKEGRAT